MLEINQEQEPPQQQEPTPTPQEKPIKTYHETYYSKGTKPKTPKTKTKKTAPPTWKPSYNEGINSIERNIDTIDTQKKSATSSKTCKETDIERKVDGILRKKHK